MYVQASLSQEAGTDMYIVQASLSQGASTSTVCTNLSLFKIEVVCSCPALEWSTNIHRNILADGCTYIPRNVLFDRCTNIHRTILVDGCMY